MNANISTLPISVLPTAILEILENKIKTFPPKPNYYKRKQKQSLNFILRK